MSLLETLIMGVGAGVAKGVVKLWLKDDVLGREIGLGLIDYLKRKTQDLLAAREGERQFERISDGVAKNVLQLFEREGASISEGGRIAVARAAGETINETQNLKSLVLSGAKVSDVTALARLAKQLNYLELTPL